ncbi:MAG: formylglycine-generating enzyme family protein [Alphaproteobacteria bacterium]|nr:formylglycine-generating enzyme family protein [Alphaproteobacteria bacterium]
MPLRLATVALALGAAAACGRGASSPATVDDGPPAADRCRPDGKGPTECWLAVPGATLQMGAQAHDPGAPGYDPDADDDEGPVHTVQVSPFWILRSEVSVSTWVRCVGMEDCDPAAVTIEGFSTWRGPGTGAGVQVPVNNLTWDGAVALCRSIHGRLPTEAEWERAARGTDGRRWPWGDTAGCGTSASAGTTRIGQAVSVDTMALPPCDNLGPVSPEVLTGPSPVGAVGMAGNVWEWVADWYGPYDAGTRGAVDPTGPPTGTRRVQRGGGWMAAEARGLRTTVRSSMAPDARASDVGVRCVWDPSAGPADAP